MPFPLSPTNNQIYVKGSTPYIYASASNSWTQTTDPNLVAGNIKNGVSILGVTGNYVSSLGTLQSATLSANLTIYYYVVGHTIIITYATDGTSQGLLADDSFTLTQLENFFGTMFGVSITSYIEDYVAIAITAPMWFYTGTNWGWRSANNAGIVVALYY